MAADRKEAKKDHTAESRTRCREPAVQVQENNEEAVDLSFWTIINRNPILSQKETMELLGKKGTSEWRAARDRLVLSNLRLVTSVASGYLWIDGYSLDDIISYGVIGLIKAVDRYDANAGTKLSTYATYWIKETINEEIYAGGQIRNPMYIAKLVARMSRIQHDAEQANGSELPIENVAKIMDLPLEKAQTIAKIRDRGRMLSFDAPVRQDISEETDSLGDFLPSDADVEEIAIRRVMHRDLVAAIRKLQPNEQKAILLRFGFLDGTQMTFAQCGKLLGCSKETVRRLVESALQKLKANYTKALAA